MVGSVGRETVLGKPGGIIGDREFPLVPAGEIDLSDIGNLPKLVFERLGVFAERESIIRAGESDCQDGLIIERYFRNSRVNRFFWQIWTDVVYGIADPPGGVLNVFAGCELDADSREGIRGGRSDFVGSSE